MFVPLRCYHYFLHILGRGQTCIYIFLRESCGNLVILRLFLGTHLCLQWYKYSHTMSTRGGWILHTTWSGRTRRLVDPQVVLQVTWSAILGYCIHLYSQLTKITFLLSHQWYQTWEMCWSQVPIKIQFM